MTNLLNGRFAGLVLINFCFLALFGVLSQSNTATAQAENNGQNSIAQAEKPKPKSTFNGRVRRVRLRERNIKEGIKVVATGEVECDPGRLVRSLSFDFQDYTGPNPSPNPLSVPFRSMEDKSYNNWILRGKNECDLESNIAVYETDELTFDANPLGQTYTVVVTMRDANGNALGVPAVFVTGVE